MQAVSTIAELRQIVSTWRAQGQRIALVPTMGNLHAGHLQLVDEARARADRVVVSIFVNPMQFVDSDGKLGDFDRYPRTLQADLDKLAAVDVVFTPLVDEVYPAGFENETRVEVPEISDILCGAYRPGHFVGVATVVAKLFNMVMPDLALFGEKDYQQLLVICRMAKELCFPVEVIGVATKREANGLALSSRNQYLSVGQREQAARIYQTLLAIKAEVQTGNKNYSMLEETAVNDLNHHGFSTDYVVIRDAADLSSPSTTTRRRIVLVAAWLGTARLIDNLYLD